MDKETVKKFVNLSQNGGFGASLVLVTTNGVISGRPIDPNSVSEPDIDHDTLEVLKSEFHGEYGILLSTAEVWHCSKPPTIDVLFVPFDAVISVGFKS